MTGTGTAAYDGWPDLPPLVSCAVDAARAAGFPNCCLPQQGELLRVLARGVGPGTIGETGTGHGAGLAWLASAAHPGATLTSVERDPARAAAVAHLFRDHPAVRVCHGDWVDLRPAGPFDLLVLDGGGQGKGGEPPVDPVVWLRPGGLLVLDDFSPSLDWPPRHAGRIDTARYHWLSHPDLHTTEVNVTPEAVTILARFRGRAS